MGPRDIGVLSIVRHGELVVWEAILRLSFGASLGIVSRPLQSACSWSVLSVVKGVLVRVYVLLPSIDVDLLTLQRGRGIKSLVRLAAGGADDWLQKAHNQKSILIHDSCTG